ncbi:MAG: PKD domain-containing protein [Bacteroidia bacterium]|nr:PKD domain-containing protein [Bacteroidia bacterium]
MPKLKCVSFIFLVLICICFTMRGQISITPSAGCAPLSCTLSGPAGATAVSWTLGGTAGTSTLNTVNPLYATAGTYNITYTAIVGGSPVSYTGQVVASAGPNASYSFVQPSTHCIPMTVSFTGQSSSTGSFNWSFGDISPIASGNSVSHTYTFSGSFVPLVTFSDAVSGCTINASPPANPTIQVSSPPVPNIQSSTGFIGCSPPFTANVTGSNSINGSPIGGGVLAYNWTFNGGSPATSNVPSPGQVVYSNMGIYTASLQLTDNNQCSSVGTVAIVVSNPTISIIVSPTVCFNTPIPATVQTSQSGFSLAYSTPSVVAPGPVLPLPEMVGPYQYTMMPGGSITFKDSLCFFKAEGAQTITAYADVGPGCPVTSVQTVVFVERVVADYTWTAPHMTCGPTMTASYINLSTTNTSLTMNYTFYVDYPPSTSNFVNGVAGSTFYIANNIATQPTFTFGQGSANPYTIYQYFIPNITLVAKSNSIAHCKGDTIHYSPDTLGTPTAFFYPDKRTGCAPLTVRLRNNSYYIPWNSVTGYTWCNGATPPTFVTGVPPTPYPNDSIPNQTFTYTTPGIYRPYLIIGTSLGCTDTSFKDSIIVVDPPTVSASFPTDVCAGQPVTINVSASPGTAGSAVAPYNKVDHYHVEADNGFFSGCVTDNHPSFKFTHVGSYPVIVTAYQAGCSVTDTMTQMINVKGPVGKFQFSTSCEPGYKKTVSFVVFLSSANQATLTFKPGEDTVLTGAGDRDTTLYFMHTYSTKGSYTVTLKSHHATSGCPDYLFSRTVRLFEPKAVIKWNGQDIPSLPTALACTKRKFQFGGEMSEDVSSSCSRGYEWFFQTPTYTLMPFETANPSFSVHYSGAGPPFPIPLPFGFWVDPIARDTFRLAGNYTLSLVVRDDNGCTDTVVKPFRVSSAVPDFTFAANPFCNSDQPVQFINNTQANQVYPDSITSYTWTTGDGGVIIANNDPLNSPTHSYTPVYPPHQIYTVTCVAINNVGPGCRDTTKHVLQINNPYANMFVDNPTLCITPFQPATANFTTLEQSFSTYSISFGDEPNPPVWTVYNGGFHNVSHVYSTPDTCLAQLVVADDDGCTTTQSLSIHVFGQPTASIGFQNNKQDFCFIGQPTIVSQGATYITPVTFNQWTIKGVTNPPPGQDTVIDLFPPGLNVVTLTVSVDGNCPSVDTKTIGVYEPHAVAIPEKTTICFGEPLKVSVGEFQDIYTWKWFFGDNVPQNPIYASAPNGTINPKVTYNYTTLPTAGPTGIATVQLLYSPPGNACELADEFNLRIIKLEPDFANQSNTYAHCLNIEDQFSNLTPNISGLNINYNWSFGDGSVEQNSGGPVQYNYSLAGVFTITLSATDLDFSCKAETVKQMTIFPLPSAAMSVNKKIICPSDSFLLLGSGTPGVSGILTGNLSYASTTQTLNLAPDNSFTLNFVASTATEYSLVVKDNNSCESAVVTKSIDVVKEYIQTIPWDTVVVIGQPTPLNGYAGLGYTYSWTPNIIDLNCDTCNFYNPVSSTTVNTTYTLMIQDSMACYNTPWIYKIKVNPIVSIDVPTAFTPNGDGINDFIFPDGWGLKKIIYFKVFNRWGHLLFETNGTKVGWDGLYQGVPQNMETYVYQVSAETLLESEPTLIKTGTFKLIR